MVSPFDPTDLGASLGPRAGRIGLDAVMRSHPGLALDQVKQGGDRLAQEAGNGLVEPGGHAPRRAAPERGSASAGASVRSGLERALRPIPLGKRNWLFTSSEVGAQRVGIIESLLVTCRLHAVDSYTYLVDVLQRISVHPANRAIELTPRMWKSLFAAAPLRSDLGPRALLQT